MTIRYYPETTGLCNDIDNDMNKKLCFFEIDSFNLDDLIRVKSHYDKFNLDYIIHKSKMGFHFISPTITNKETWRLFLSGLKDLNVDFPAICLRIQGNKYPGEELYFYNSITYMNTKGENNCKDLCNLLNKIFGSSLVGTSKGSIKLVKYKPHIEESKDIIKNVN